MKKPDRFERVVLAELKKNDTKDDPAIWLNAPDIVVLLRREHQDVVRLVRKVQDWQAGQSVDGESAIAVILQRLKRRMK